MQTSAALELTPTTQAPLTVLVVEHGAAFPSAGASGGRDRVVVAQRPGELALVFARRAAERIQRELSLGRSVGQAEVSIGPDASEAALEGRYLIARSILRFLPPSEPERLTFYVGAHAANRHAVFALAAVLGDGLHGASLPVRVELARHAIARR